MNYLFLDCISYTTPYGNCLDNSTAGGYCVLPLYELPSNLAIATESARYRHVHAGV